MNYREMMDSVEDARATMQNANYAARRIAPLLVGRLRHCDHNTLNRLKRELRGYNIHTGKWNEDRA